MPRVAREWPTRALWALEDVKAALKDIDALAREAQMLTRDNDRLQAVIVVGDIRTKALTAFDTLSKARNGDYD